MGNERNNTSTSDLFHQLIQGPRSNLVLFDGGRVARGLLPERLGHRLDILERYGLIIVVGLIMLGLLTPVVVVTRILVRSLGVPPIF